MKGFNYGPISPRKIYLFDLNGYMFLRNALSIEEVNALNQCIDLVPEQEPGTSYGNIHFHD